MAVEVSIEDNSGDPRGRSADYIVTFGDRQIDALLVGTRDDRVNPWIKEVQRIQKADRRRKKGGPINAGLCFFRSRGYSGKLPAGDPNQDICMIGICVGSHCLFYEAYSYGEVDHSLKCFLADKRFNFIGVNMERDAAKLEKQWGVHMANRTELVPLVESAFGVKLPPVKGGGATGLERMAKVVLGGIEVNGKPGRVAECSWNRPSNPADLWGLSQEQIMHATVDAFLVYEMGSKCLDMVNNGGRSS